MAFLFCSLGPTNVPSLAVRVITLEPDSTVRFAEASIFTFPAIFTSPPAVSLIPVRSVRLFLNLTNPQVFWKVKDLLLSVAVA